MAKDIWDIPDSNHTMDITAEERYWISEHSSGYDILSLTDCQSVLDDLLANIESHLSTVSRSKSLDEVKILIPGCGTRVKLEVAIAQNFPGVQIHCGDFTDVIGFEIERLEVYFFDKPDVFERVRRHYAEFFHPDTDVVFYEHYLEAVPQRKSRGESERASN